MLELLAEAGALAAMQKGVRALLAVAPQAWLARATSGTCRQTFHVLNGSGMPGVHLRKK